MTRIYTWLAAAFGLGTAVVALFPFYSMVVKYRV